MCPTCGTRRGIRTNESARRVCDYGIRQYCEWFHWCNFGVLPYRCPSFDVLRIVPISGVRQHDLSMK